MSDFFAKYAPPRPRWKCRNEDDVKALTRWTHVELDLRIVHRDPATLTKAEWLDIAVKDADRGDLMLLKELYPRLERFLCAPNTGRRGPRPKKKDSVTSIKAAYDDVLLIREIWQKTFGHWKRGERPFAEQIAADRNGIDVRSVKGAFKNKSRYRDMPSLLTKPPH